MVSHIGTQEIETERLRLRRLTAGDAEAAHRNWTADEEVFRFLRRKPHMSLEETREKAAEWERDYADNRYFWGIQLKGGELIGSVSCCVEDRDDAGEVGYAIGRAYWGNGYMVEALKAVIDCMFERVGLNRVEGIHSVRNPASGRVMEKAGMWLEGRPRQQYKSCEGYEDCCLYGITRDIWEMQKEIAAYRALRSHFEDFIEPTDLTDGEVTLVCTLKTPAQPEKKWVPSYTFEIRANGARVGETNLRIGYTDGLYFGGHIGYHIDEGSRGHGYAGKACNLLVPVMRAHGMDRALITNNVTNDASRRVCEKLGARLVRRAELPEWHDLYAGGVRHLNLYEWEFGDGIAQEVRREIGADCAAGGV